MEDTSESRGFALLFADSYEVEVEVERRFEIVLQGGSEAAVIEGLADGLAGAFQLEGLEDRYVELRRAMPGVPGIWGRAVKWGGGELRATSTLGRETGGRGGAKATLSGSLPSGVTYHVEITVGAANADEAVRALEHDLFGVYDLKAEASAGDRSEILPGVFAWRVVLRGRRFGLTLIP